MRSKQLEAARKQRTTYDDYRRVFNTPHGKRVLHDLMRQFHMLGPGFDPNPYENARMSGETNVVKYVLTKLKANIKTLEKYIEEAENERR